MPVQTILHPIRRRLTLLLGAVTVAGAAIATLPVAPTAVAAEEPPAAAEPMFVDEELSLVVDDALPRPEGAGALAGPTGRPGVFVIGEFVVHTDDPAVAEKLADQYGGSIVDTIAPPEQFSADTPAATLVRFDPGKADTSTVLEDLAAIAGEAGHGTHVVSDEAALATLAAAARARIEGNVVDLNWVAESGTIRTGTTAEAPTGPAGYNPNAFAWSQTTTLNVPPAWNLLARAGLLQPSSVRLAVVDMGFAPVDADSPAGISDAPRLANGCGGACPQHGANVASTAAAGVDNRFGGAGTGGPVARTILIDSGTLTNFAIQAAETRAISAGARIINMSLSGSVPALSAGLVGGFNGFTANVRASGILQFAAAGNAAPLQPAVDVDSVTCFIACWEADVVFPCELAGVVCVGGVASGTRVPAGGSNFGSGGLDPTATVELWGDFCALVGPDLVTPGNATHRVCGTSFATPAVAGAAALLWAANPNANIVESTLLSTAITGGCATPLKCARLIPDASRAVAALLGNLPPDISITATTPTWGVSRGSVVNFSASATDPDGTTPSVAWFVDGAPTGVTGPAFSTQFFGQSFGLHTVTATASDGRWTVPDRQGGIVVNLVNTAPTVRITSPVDGATFVNFHGIPLPCRFFTCPDEITLTAETADANNNPSRLPDAGVSWFLDGSTTAFATGHNATLAASSLGYGSHTITVRATDELGLSSQATVTISIVRPIPVWNP